MKKVKFTAIVVVMITLISCGGSIGKQPANAEGFGAIEQELKTKFGENAYYTDLTISYDESIGNIVGVTVTDKPESLKMTEWSFGNGSWNETSEVTLELPAGTQAVDFMFQLNKDINLTTLGELIEQSKKQLKAEKDIEKPVLNIANINFPNNGDLSNAEYSINLNPENGGTTFRFRYKLNGEFIEMDY